MIFKEVEYQNRDYMYTAVLNNGVTVHAFADGTGEGSDGRRYRIITHIDKCDMYDVLDDIVTDGWELIEES